MGEVSYIVLYDGRAAQSVICGWDCDGEEGFEGVVVVS